MKTAYSLLFLAAMLFTVSACNTVLPDPDPEPEILRVKFINESAAVTITSIELQARGSSTNPDPKTNNWSEQMIATDLTPGEHTFFDAEIPNLHWSQYRLWLSNNEGGEYLLVQSETMELSITHWGSNERTVSVTLRVDESTGIVGVSAWSEWAGIE